MTSKHHHHHHLFISCCITINKPKKTVRHKENEKQKKNIKRREIFHRQISSQQQFTTDNHLPLIDWSIDFLSYLFFDFSSLFCFFVFSVVGVWLVENERTLTNVKRHRDGIRLRPCRQYDMRLDSDGSVALVVSGASSRRHAGVYTCTVTNEMGQVSSSARVIIKTPTSSHSSTTTDHNK